MMENIAKRVNKFRTWKNVIMFQVHYYSFVFLHKNFEDSIWAKNLRVFAPLAKQVIVIREES